MEKGIKNNPEEPQVSPQEEREMQAYVSGLSKMLHGKDTRDKVYGILKAGPPEKTIPEAALLINGQMEDAARSKGKPPSLKVLLNSGVYLVSDLAEIGLAGGFWQLTEDQMPPILQETMQKYIEVGIKKGTVDPLEIQGIAEKNLSPEQREQGLSMGQQTGVPGEMDNSVQMEAYASGRERKMQDKFAQKEAASNAGALKGAIAQPQPQQQGGQ